MSLKELQAKALEASSEKELEEVFRGFLVLLQESPAKVELWEGFGNFLLERLGDTAQSLTVFRKLQTMQPKEPLWFLKELSILSRVSWEAVLETAQKARGVFPLLVDFINWEGTAWLNLEEYEQARDAFSECLKKNPEFAPAHYNLGLALMRLDEFESALDAFEECLRHRPDDVMAHQNAAHAALGLGRLEEGFRHWSHRLARLRECPDGIMPKKAQEIRLKGEQGMGDVLFYLRFLPEVERRLGWTKIALWAPSKLKEVVESLYPGIEFHTVVEEEIPGDYVAIGDLPSVLGESALGCCEPLRVYSGRDNSEPVLGFSWRSGHSAEGVSNPDSPNHKEVPLEECLPILQELGCKVRILQRHPQAEEMKLLQESLGERLEDFSSANEDPMKLLKSVGDCDFLLGVSSTTFHLALHTDCRGVLLATVPPDFRWGLTGDSSKWLPGFSVLRQSRDRSWTSALTEARKRLLDWEIEFRSQSGLQDERAQAKLALLLHRASRYEEAEGLFSRTYQACRNPDLGHIYAKILLEAGKLKQAEAILEEIGGNPAYAQAKILLKFLQGDFPKAYEESLLAWEAGIQTAELADWSSHLAFLNQDLKAGWDFHRLRPTATGNPLQIKEPLRPSLQGKSILLIQDQGLGDELFFLKWIPLLREAGAKWIGYVTQSKMAPLLKNHPALDFCSAAEELTFEPDHIFLVGDLPYLLDSAGSPGEFLLFPQGNHDFPELFRDCPRPWLGLTWRSGVQTGHRVSRALSKSIDPKCLGETLQNWPGTIFLLQRNPSEEEVAELVSSFSGAWRDATSLNENLIQMLSFLAELDEYVCTSNTNLHMYEALGKKGNVLVPFPPEYRWGNPAYGTCLMQSTPFYQTPQGWEESLEHLKFHLFSKERV